MVNTLRTAAIAGTLVLAIFTFVPQPSNALAPSCTPGTVHPISCLEDTKCDVFCGIVNCTNPPTCTVRACLDLTSSCPVAICSQTIPPTSIGIVVGTRVICIPVPPGAPTGVVGCSIFYPGEVGAYLDYPPAGPSSNDIAICVGPTAGCGTGSAGIDFDGANLVPCSPSGTPCVGGSATGPSFSVGLNFPFCNDIAYLPYVDAGPGRGPACPSGTTTHVTIMQPGASGPPYTPVNPSVCN